MASATSESVRAHLDACSDCRLRVERLRAGIVELQCVAVQDPGGVAPASAATASPAGANDRASETQPVGAASSIDTEPDESPDRPATIGRYRIVDQLDAGGQATVYRAVHPSLPRDLVIKIAHEPASIDRSLLRSDAAILCELDHPNLVRVYDLDMHEGRPFVVMEFVRGRNLKQIAEQSLPPDRQAAAWVAEVAGALEYAHRCGIIHQDIKPHNILLDESGRPRLIDFGVARWQHGWTESHGGPSGGTLAFMAPEQARGEAHRISAASDIFALGGVLYFLLSGKVPFPGATRSEQWQRASQCDFDRGALSESAVPRSLQRIVLRAMAAEPDARFVSAGAMAKALDAFLARPRRVALASATLLVAALAVAASALWPRLRPGLLPAAGNDRADAAPSPPTSIPGKGGRVREPLRVESFQVILHQRTADDPAGPIGANVLASRSNQDARIKARLNMPAYCFLIALNPDGSNELCVPEDQAVAPSRTAMIDYPTDATSGFALTDGLGTQAFVLVVSEKPLGPYAQWSASGFDALPWKPVGDAGVWRYDGHSFDRDVERGGVRRLADLPPPLEATCRALQAGPGISAIRAVAFPVRARDKSKVQERSN
jgi:serine/threonine protein kinase